ncbi:AEC family transporter [Bacillus taeanensis]|uniref:AEC family transporter n=1 Tax=Bacillus taeanensis TaxID=273032 RepID=A0A366XWS1_9BACI|nr:AEC family transporter [Bacillus taeanensis]RBW68593.1 AEC family transporter [Bacillus taeanensis]
MEILFLIIMKVIFPVFLLIVVGAFLHRKYTFDMGTLSKLNNFLLMPAVCFANIYESKISGSTLLYVMSFLLLQALFLICVSISISKIYKFEYGLSATFKNSVVLVNSGNFGLPVSQLVFQHNPLGLSVQIVVLIFQNLLTYTYGLFNCVSVDKKGFQAIKVLLKNPVFYAFLLGIFLQTTSIKIPEFIWTPIENTSHAFLAIALITLGAQSAFIKIHKLSTPLVLSLLGRLVLGPCIAFVTISVLGLEGTIAQALFIASSFPTSRNSSLFALEYGNHPEYAAQAVLLTTLCSVITVTTVVYIYQT